MQSAIFLLCLAAPCWLFLEPAGAFSTQKPSFLSVLRLPSTSSYCPITNNCLARIRISHLHSTSASHEKTTGTESESDNNNAEEDLPLDISALEELSEEWGDDFEDDDAEEIINEDEMLSALDETSVGSLSLDQISFLRDMISCFGSSTNDEQEEVAENHQEETPIIAERLLFRLLDEWQAAISSDEKDDLERADALHPTLEDFIVVMKAWEKETIKYTKSRRKDANSEELIDRVLNLFGILEDLWQEGNLDELKPNQETLEIVLRVMASSRQRGMDRRVCSVFESIRDGQLYGFGPSCDMYQSVILSLSRSRDRGSSERAEKILKEAVGMFPPQIDSATKLPTGVSIESFNKVLVSWAKSRDEDGPERAERLIVFMDELGDAVKPNLSSFTTLIDAYAQQNDWEGVSYSERIFNRVLDEYMEGTIEEEPNIATWTIVMCAWTRLTKKGFRGSEEKANNLLKRMEALYEDERISFGPDAIAYVACMSAWAVSKNKIGPTQAELILNEMHEKFMDGDDSMKPSARSIQMVIDSWVKGGGEESMEQAEHVLDRYDDHLDSLEPPGGPEQAKEDVAGIYRTMVLGWSKYDPERAQDYLLDMIDRDMKLDNFSFDKLIEANTQLLPEDPDAMKRIFEIFEVMEKCRQAGNVQPNERVYTSFIRAMTRAKIKNLAVKANKILQRMNVLFEEGNKGIKPTVFTYNAVLNACAETLNTEAAKPMEAFKIALEIFNQLRGQNNKQDGLDQVSFGNMLKCSNLLPETPQKNKFISTTFKVCCDKGLVNEFVLRDLVNCAPEEVWRPLLDCPRGEPDIEMLPREWSATINSKKKPIKKKPIKKKTFRRER